MSCQATGGKVSFAYELGDKCCEGTYTVYDALGKVIEKADLNSQKGDIQLNTSRYAKGVYRITVFANETFLGTKGFVVQ